MTSLMSSADGINMVVTLNVMISLVFELCPLGSLTMSLGFCSSGTLLGVVLSPSFDLVFFCSCLLWEVKDLSRGEGSRFDLNKVILQFLGIALRMSGRNGSIVPGLCTATCLAHFSPII